jgi:hypothetical protein
VLTLPLDVRTVPARDDVLLTDEEPLVEQTFDADRRISGYLIVGGGPANPGRTELFEVTEAKLDGLVARNDAAAALRQNRANR